MRGGRIVATATAIVAGFVFAGCTSTYKDRLKVKEMETARLSAERQALLEQNAQKDADLEAARAEVDRLATEVEAGRAARSDLEAARARLASLQGGGTGIGMQDPSVNPDVLRQQLASAGIKDLIVEARPSGVALVFSSDITFQPGSATLHTGAAKTLKNFASFLRAQYPNARLRIEGHTDSDPIRKSKWESNEQLSLVRAEAVKAYLVARGLSDATIETVGLGPTRPIDPGSSMKAKARNRRIELYIAQR